MAFFSCTVLVKWVTWGKLDLHSQHLSCPWFTIVPELSFSLNYAYGLFFFPKCPALHNTCLFNFAVFGLVGIASVAILCNSSRRLTRQCPLILAASFSPELIAMHMFCSLKWPSECTSSATAPLTARLYAHTGPQKPALFSGFSLFRPYPFKRVHTDSHGILKRMKEGVLKCVIGLRGMLRVS